MSRTEGPLSDPRAQRERQKSEKLVNDLYAEDLRFLSRDGRFRRWLGKHAVPVLMTNSDTTNGGLLLRAAGERSIIFRMLKEFDDIEPGFYGLLLDTRKAIDAELRILERQEPTPEEDEGD